jgi:hypothetical protein
MTNVTDSDILSGTITVDISDHLPVFYCCKDLNMQKRAKSRMTRSFTYENMSAFRDNLRGINWNRVTSKQDVDDALDEFLDTFHTFYELNFPLRKRRFNRNFDRLNGFMTKGLMTSRRQKNVLFNKQIRHPTHENVDGFRRYRNIYNSLLRKSKKLYYDDQINKAKSKPIKLWNILKKVSGIQNDTAQISEISDGSNIIKDDKMIAEIFNDHFSSIGKTIQDSVIPTETDPISYIPNNPNVPAFEILGLGPIHILDVIKSMPGKNSSDINNISMKLIKFVQYEICVPLAYIFRLSIDSGIFPQKFKNTGVVPIFKNGSPLSPDNYRPIALVNCFSKILERIVATSLYNHLDLNELLYIHQYGFQRGKSTEHNLVQITNYIGQALNDGNWCIGVFLDLKKAFDTVQHDILLKKLVKFGINGNFLDWFKSYLSGRKQCVDINGSYSNFRDIIMSVLQGSSLGPILFLCFINDIHHCTNLNLFLFADDSNALAQNSNLHDLVTYVNVELQKLATWFKANKLVINAEKTKYMIFHTKNRRIDAHNLDIYFNFNEIGAIELPELKFKLTRVFNGGTKGNQTYKLLGVLFDEHLSFNEHVTYMQSKIAKSLFILNRSKHFISKKALKMLYFSLVHSHLTYCPIIYSIASKSHFNNLMVQQKKAVRIISDASYNEHTAPLFITHEILRLDYLIIQSKLTFMHSIKYQYCPKSFRNVFISNPPDNLRYDLRNTNDFMIPRARIEMFKKMPIYTLPLEWNNSGDLQFYQNTATFKIILKETLLKKFATDNNIGE